MGTLYANGVSAGDLATALLEMLTSWNATMVLLDADLGVTAIDYGDSDLTAIVNIDTLGLAEQGDIITRLQECVTNLATVTAKLDADDLTDSDYASKLDITDTINTSLAGSINDEGMGQGKMISMVSAVKTAFNALMAKLDGDATVQTTTYVSANEIEFEIDTTGA